MESKFFQELKKNTKMSALKIERKKWMFDSVNKSNMLVIKFKVEKYF